MMMYRSKEHMKGKKWNRCIWSLKNINWWWQSRTIFWSQSYNASLSYKWMNRFGSNYHIFQLNLFRHMSTVHRNLFFSLWQKMFCIFICDVYTHRVIFISMETCSLTKLNLIPTDHFGSMSTNRFAYLSYLR